MNLHRTSSALLALFAGFLSLAAAPCTGPTTLIYNCPTGTQDDGSNTGVCTSYSLTLGAGAADPLGTSTPTFYYLSYDLGFVLGNGILFSEDTTSTGTFVPDISTSFGQGPIVSTGLVTEQFDAVAIYTSTNGGLLGLTGYIVAAGYALLPSGNVAGLIARYTPQGGLDPAFGGGKGYILTGTSGFTGGSLTVFRGVAIDSSGNIIVGGYGNTTPGRGTSYLGNLATATSASSGVANTNDFDPHGLVSGVSNDEILGFVARYDWTGELDTTFSRPATVPAPDERSAVNGFSVSPPSFNNSTAKSGYAKITSSLGNRFDIINAVAVDSSDGIYAVGGSAKFSSLAGEQRVILHFKKDGTLNGVDTGVTVGREYYNAVAVTSDRAVVAGTRITGVGTGFGYLAKYYMKTTTAISLDTDFGTTGVYVPANIAAAALEEYNSITIDSVNSGTLVVGGRSAGAQALLRTFTSAGVDANGGRAAGIAGGAEDSIHATAVLTSGSTTRYYAVGMSKDATPNAHSLVSSWQTDLSTDTDFLDTPYYNSVFSSPTMYTSTLVNAHVGINQGGATAFAGGLHERFNAAAVSPDGTIAVVVGYSSNSATSPLNGRIFPIVLFYSIDGTFPNLALLDSASP